MTTNPYFAEDCRKVLVAEREGGMVEILMDDEHAVMVPASEARGLAMKLVLIASIAEHRASK